MNKTIYDNKLAHYASREPRSFLQLDAFYLPHNDDPDLDADKDGDALMGGATIELMNGASVRVLLPHNADPKVVVRQLKKITKEFNQHPDFLWCTTQVPEEGEASIHDPFPF